MYGVLISALLSFGSWILSRLFAAFGIVTIGAYVYEPLLNYISSKIFTNLSSTGAETYAFLNFVGITSAVNILLAAVTLKIGIRTARAAFAKKGASNA
jgi:hypothetical protein